MRSFDIIEEEIYEDNDVWAWRAFNVSHVESVESLPATYRFTKSNRWAFIKRRKNGLGLRRIFSRIIYLRRLL